MHDFLYAHRPIRVFIVPHHQKMSVYNFGRQNCGRRIWVDTASSTNIVRLPHRRVDTARALVHVIAADAAHKESLEWALHHLF